MARTFLITRPKYDYTTRYLYSWAEKVKNFAKSRGDKVLDLDDDRANKKEFESVVKKTNPAFMLAFMFLNGHGNEVSVTGQHGEVLVDEGNSLELLISKVIYALTCRSGRGLGKKSVERGAVAYIGYDEDFIFMYSESKRTRPQDDKTAALFLDPSNQVAISLLKGQAVEEASRRSKDFFVRNIRSLLTSESPAQDTAAIRFLYWDMVHQVYHGDGSAVI